MRRNTLNIIIAAILLCAGADGARPFAATDAAPAAVIPTVPLGKPFGLTYDHLVRVGNTGVGLRFVEMLEDSRCPPDVQCIQAGRVRVRLELSPPGKPAEFLELSTDADANRRRAAGLTLELLAVTPAAEAVKHAQHPETYSLRLRARRNGGY